MPASILERSRMSLMIASRCLPARSIFSRSAVGSLAILLGGQLLEQLAVADDGVQGRAQLVAHVGEERALDPAGLHGLLVGVDQVGVDQPQLRLDPLAPRISCCKIALARASSAVRSLTRRSSSSWAWRRASSARFRAGDVEGDALEVEGMALLVADHLGLAMDPDHAAVAGQEAVLGAEMPPRGAGLRELGVPADAVVGVELPVPEDRVLQPFLLREAQQRLDLGADVQLVVLLAPATP